MSTGAGAGAGDARDGGTWATPSPLDRVTELVARAGDLAEFTADVAESPDPAQAAKAAKGARKVAEDLRLALAILSNLGGTLAVPDRTAGGRPVKKPDPSDLSALRTLDTPAARELLAALETAAEKARAVDRERGDVDPATGEPDGWAEWLAEQALRLRLQVEGHPGSGRE